MPKIPKIIAPIFLFAFYVLVALFIKDKFSDTKTFINAIESIYASFGYPLIFISGVSESIFLVGFFAPGAVSLLMGAALAKIGVVNYLTVFILGTGGLLVGYIINYFLGKYGWHHVLSLFGLKRGIEVVRERLKRHRIKTILWGYFFPGSASLISTAAGVLHMDFKEFILLSFLAQSIWSLFWGVLAYFFGLKIVEFIIKYFAFLLLGIAVVWVLKQFKKS